MDASDWPAYLADRLATGWTQVTVKGDYEDICDWMIIHAGQQHPSTSWDVAAPESMWEITNVNHSEEIYGTLVRDPKVAVLAKLTWG